ncbi:MAG: phospholipid scramblase-related protein [Planctomycetaceae bacterium]
MLDRRAFMVKQEVRLMQVRGKYGIFCAETGEELGRAEEKVGGIDMVLRLLINKRLLPATFHIFDNEDDVNPIMTIKRGMAIFRSKVTLTDGDGVVIGSFKSKVLSIGGGFYVLNAEGVQIAEVNGDWKGWNFRMIAENGKEIGTVSKKWAGALKEIFTQADNYVIQLDESVGSNQTAVRLLLAAGLAVDMIYKE